MSIPGLNDSKLIGISVYNVVILCLIGVAVSVVINNDPEALFLFVSCIILFCTSITLTVVFVPKASEWTLNVHRFTLNSHSLKIMTLDSVPKNIICWGAVVFEKWVKQCHENNWPLRRKLFKLYLHALFYSFLKNDSTAATTTLYTIIIFKRCKFNLICGHCVLCFKMYPDPLKVPMSWIGRVGPWKAFETVCYKTHYG